jgi:hypothetical protein
VDSLGRRAKAWFTGGAAASHGGGAIADPVPSKPIDD